MVNVTITLDASTHSVNIYLIDTYYVSSVILGTEDTAVIEAKKKKKSCAKGA